MTRTRPKVATTSDKKWAGVARWWAEIVTAALENSRWRRALRRCNRPPERVGSPTPVAGAAGAVTGQARRRRCVCEHGIDLPRRTVGVVGPGFVLHGIAAGRRLLDLGDQALLRQATGGLLDLPGGLDFDTQMVEGAGGTRAPRRGVLDQDQPLGADRLQRSWRSRADVWLAHCRTGWSRTPRRRRCRTRSGLVALGTRDLLVVFTTVDVSNMLDTFTDVNRRFLGWPNRVQ